MSTGHHDSTVPGVPPRVQLLDETGAEHQHPVFSAYLSTVSGEELEEIYRSMTIARRVDEEATSLQRQGQLVLWVPLRGQEAAQVASVWASEPTDRIYPSYREHAVAFHRGVTPGQLLRLFRGVTAGGWDPDEHQLNLYTMVLAAQVPHAVGYAMGIAQDARLAAEGLARPETVRAETAAHAAAHEPRDDDAAGSARTAEAVAAVVQGDPGHGPVVGFEDGAEDGPADGVADGVPRRHGEAAASSEAVIAYFGDGASTEGEIHESMVFAASYNAPVLFFVQNNQWAISVPFSTQSRVPLATRAAGYGFEGIRVDGNDVLAVLAATRYALEKLRAGQGPVLIEAETYRMGAHTTADDPTKYRERDEEEQWGHLDPLARLAAHLRNDYGVGDEFFDAVTHDADEVARQLRADVLSMPEPAFEEFFGKVYAQEHSLVAAERAEYLDYQAGFDVSDDHGTEGARA